MGFSLKAALAGAIQGGAHAVGEIADFQIKSAEEARVREENFARQKELVNLQDELMAARERRVDEMKTAREEKQRDDKATALRGALTSLSAAGIDPGSIKGQQMIATHLGDKGYTELADKYFDNAIKLGQIESAEKLALEQTKLRHATVAEARASREAAHADKEFLRGFEVAVKAGHNLKIADPDDPAKTKNFSAAGSAFGALFSELVDAKVPRTEAMRIVGNTAQELGRAIDDPKIKADPHAVLSALIDKARVNAGLVEPPKAEVKTSGTGTTQTPPVTKKDVDIPGVMFNSGTNPTATGIGSDAAVSAMRKKAQTDATSRFGALK